jgi:ankyrin repeat protein
MTATLVGILRAVVLDVWVDINAADCSGKTPLHAATLKRNVSAMWALCELRADVDRQSNHLLALNFARFQ